MLIQNTLCREDAVEVIPTPPFSVLPGTLVVGCFGGTAVVHTYFEQSKSAGGAGRSHQTALYTTAISYHTNEEYVSTAVFEVEVCMIPGARYFTRQKAQVVDA